jgi:RimJ/RimL family protein N-acetyltransferase
MSVDERWPNDGTITLRPLTHEDVEQGPAGDDELADWLNDGSPGGETVRWHISRGTEQWAAGGPSFSFAIRTVADDVLVGTIEVQLDQQFLTAGQANIAYLLYPLWRGYGFATRAVLLTVGFLRLHTDIREAVILTLPENPTSAAVARRAGFRPAGQGDDGQHVLNRHLLTIR